jgi:outer membrane murein-binding lipoprotein Lpp
MSSEVATQVFVKAEIDAFRTETNARFERVEADIHELKTDVGQLKTDVRQLKTDVRQLKTDVGQLKTDVGEMKITMGELQITMRQIEVRARNGKLKNPTARIRPIPIFTQGRGAQEPDPAYFPKYANQLYGLRKPENERDHQMLAYLSAFYDIQQEAADASESGEKVQVDPDRAVELLEEILGLDEDNFIEFRTRAQRFADQGPPAAEKRDWPATGSSGEQPQPQRRRLQTPSAGSTVPFTKTPSRAYDGSPTAPFTETPSRAAPERLSNIHTVAARPRRPSTTIPDSEETASS